MTEKNSDDAVSQKTGSTYGMTDCQRCGDGFQVQLCEVHQGPIAGTNRKRVEAYLCYTCRQKTTNKVIE